MARKLKTGYVPNYLWDEANAQRDRITNEYGPNVYGARQDASFNNGNPVKYDRASDPEYRRKQREREQQERNERLKGAEIKRQFDTADAIRRQAGAGLNELKQWSRNVGVADVNSTHALADQAEDLQQFFTANKGLYNERILDETQNLLKNGRAVLQQKDPSIGMNRDQMMDYMYQLGQQKQQAHEQGKSMLNNMRKDDNARDREADAQQRIDALKAYNKELRRQNKLSEYSMMMQNPDFAENSKYQSTVQEREQTAGDQIRKWMPGQSFQDTSFDLDEEYERVNQNREYIDILDQSRKETEAQATYGLFEESAPVHVEYEMTDEERSIYNYLYKTQSREAAHAYLEDLRPELNRRSAAEENAAIKEMTSDAPTAAVLSLYSVLNKPYVGAKTLGSQLALAIAGKEIDPYDPTFMASRMNTNIRGNVGQEISDLAGGGTAGDLANRGYQTVMSLLDNVYGVALGGGLSGGQATENMVLATMGTDAASSKMLEMLENGSSQNRAVILGLAAGATEIITEKIGLDNLFNSTWKGGREALRALGRQVFAEGAEEGLADLMNWTMDDIYDAISSKSQSEWEQTVKQIMAETGMNRSQAMGKALGDRMAELGLDIAGGSLSGGLMGGGAALANNIQLSEQGREIKKDLPNYSPLQNMNSKKLAEYAANIQQTQQMDEASESILREAAEQMVNEETVAPDVVEAIMEDDNTLGMLEQETETEINSEEEMLSALQKYAAQQAEPQQIQTEQTAVEESSPKPQNASTGVSEALIDKTKSEQKKDSDREMVVNYAENFAKAGMMNIGIAIDDNYDDNYDFVKYNKAVDRLVDAGYNGKDFPNTILPMKAATAIYDAAMKERSVQNVRTETNGLRRDAGRTYGENTGRQGRGVEGRTGAAYQGKRQDGLRGSEARTGVTFETEVRSANSLSLKNGTAEGKVRLVESGLSNADTMAKNMVERAFSGTSVQTFGFGSLTFAGGIQARGAISGNKIYAKIDHDRFTGASIIYHESSHKYIDQLEAKYGDRKAVVEQLYSDICKEYKDDYINKTFWEPYKEAYKGSGLEDWQIKEELICDLNGGMNELQYMEGYSKAKNATKKVEGVIHGVHQKHLDRLMKMGLEANANTQTENGQVFESRDLDAEGRKLSEGQMEFYKNVAPELRDENGNIKPYFHGTGRADRVGTVFLPERATSGPMAFFTDNREIAERYSKDKADTSLAYEDANNYHKQFVVDVDGEEILLEDYWNKLSPSEKDNYRKRAGQITYDDDYEFTVDENVSNGNGGYGTDPVLVRQAKGNAFRMLVDAWLDSGDLYGEEERFLDILNLLGIENARYKDPNARVEGVYEVYLNVTRPFVTTEVDEDFSSDVEDWLDHTDWEEYVNESWNADEWDKNNIDPYDWLDRLRRDIENNTTYAWTSIPDAITAYLKENGYDGIVDQGGKTGGYGHQVVIPFYSEQIKDINNLNPTENPDIRYSRELDAQYMYAVNSGDMETAQRMVEQAARETGYNTPKLYHGTPNFGFTTFDLTKGEMLIFATTNPKTAETYSGETNRTKISERSSLNVDDLSGEDLLNEAKKRWKKYDEYRLMTPEEKESNLEKSRSDVKYFAQIIAKYVAEHEQDFNNETREIANKMAESINHLGDSKNDLDAYMASSGFNDSMWDLKWIDEDLQLDLLQAINDAGSLDNAERELHDFMHRGDIYQNTVFDHDYVFDNQLAFELEAEQRKGIYGLYGRTDNQLVIDAEGANWNQIKPPEELELYGTQITRTIATAAERKGYDSVLLRNLKDNGGNTPYNGLSDVYIYFNSNQLKSADPVTYDDDGNVIPLSERFNLENDDIRFSREEVGTALHALNKDAKNIRDALNYERGEYELDYGDPLVKDYQNTTKRVLGMTDEEYNSAEQPKIVRELKSRQQELYRLKEDVIDAAIKSGIRPEGYHEFSQRRRDGSEKITYAKYIMIGDNGFHYDITNYPPSGLKDLGRISGQIKSDQDAIFGEREEQILRDFANNVRFSRYSRDIEFTGDLPEDLKKMADAYDSLKKDYKQLQTENRKNKRRAEYFKGETKLNVYSDNPQVSNKAAEKIAKGYVKTYNLEMDKEEQAALSHKIRKYAEDYLTGKKDFDQLADEVLPLANEIVRNAKEIYESPEKEMIDHIWNTKIKISDTVRTDIPGYAAWKKGYAGKMKISTMDGMPIEDFYRELQDAYGSTLFPDDIMNPTDMLLHIAEITDTLGGDQVYNYSDIYDMAEATQSVAFEIMQDVTSMDLHKTFADREKEKRNRLKKEMQQKAQESIKAVREHREKKLQELKDHYKEVTENKRIRREESADRKALLKIAKRLDKMKTTKANRDLIEQLVGQLDLVAVSITDGKVQNLKGLREWYEAQFDDPDFLQNLGIEKAIARLEKKQIADMNIEDVRELTNILKALEHKLRTDNKLIRDQDRRDVFLMGQQVISNIESGKGKQLGKIDDIFIAGTLTPERAIRRMTDYWDDDPLYLQTLALSKGQRDMISFQMRAGDVFKPWTSDRKFLNRIMGKKADAIKITGEFAGKAVTVDITPAMRMSLYLHSKNDDNMRHIQTGGVRVPDMKYYRKGDMKEAYAHGKLVKLTRTQIMRMAADMTEQERKACDAIYDYFNGISQQSINEVSEDLYGYSLAEVENYFPINADKNYSKGDSTYQDFIADSTIEGMGFLKERIRANNPIMLRDAFEILTQSINDTSKFVGLAIPVSNFKKILDVKLVAFEDTVDPMTGRPARQLSDYLNSVRDAIGHQWGTRGQKYIDDMLGDLEGNSRKSRSRLNAAVNRIRSNYAGAVLTLNLSVALKQAASYPTAAAVLGWGPLAKAFGNTRLSGKVDLDLIKQYTPLLWYRMQGYSTQELGDIATQNGLMNRLINGHKALNWIQAVDIATTKKLWKASEYYVRDNFKDLETGSDAYYREVANVYNQVIEETQPNYTTMQRPDLLRDDNALLQSIIMFKTQPFQNFNILYDAIGNYNAKTRHYKAVAGAEDVDIVRRAKEAKDAAGTRLTNAASAMLVSALVFAAMTFAYNMLRRKKDNYEDDEKNMTANSIADGIGKDMIASLVGTVPFGSDIWELMSSIITGEKYYGLNSVTITAMSDFAESIKGICEEVGTVLNSEEEKNGAFWNQKRIKIGKYIENIANAFGVPVANVSKLVNIVTGWAMQTKGETLSEFYGMYLEKGATSQNKKQYADLLLSAYKSGNKKDYQEMRDVLIRNGAMNSEYIDNKIAEYEKKMANQKRKEAAGVVGADAVRELNETVKSSNVWKQATKEQQSKINEKILALTAVDKDASRMLEKIEGGKSAGLTAVDFILYQAALETVKDDNAYISKDEAKAALNKISISQSEKAYLWSSQNKAEWWQKSNPYK